MKYNNAEDNSENNDLASCQNYGYSGSNSEYNETIESLIKSKGEQCEILSKLHLMAHKKYKKSELFFNIPIITITALVGFVSALDIKFEHINVIIGVLSLFVSLLKSYLSFLKISQKNENHRVAYLQYFQISNEMRIELSLSPELRKHPSYFLNLIKVKMKNLNEVSEILPTNILNQFKKLLDNDIEYNKNDSCKMTMPDVIMSIHPIDIYSDKNITKGNDFIKKYNSSPMITRVITNSKVLAHVDEYEIPENKENHDNLENRKNQENGENQENQKINIIEL
jgi:hypothetical protein